MSEQMTGPDPTLKFLALKKCFYHVFGVNENSKKKNYEKGIIIQLFSVDAIAFSKKSRKKYYKGMMTKLLFLCNPNSYHNLKVKYRISTYSFRENYSFLTLALCTVTFDHST